MSAMSGIQQQHSNDSEGGTDGKTTTSSSAGNGSKFKFHPGQKVFCFHGNFMYDARCVKTQLRDGIPEYFIHYHGWNKNWDEWASEDRVLEHNEENKQKCEQLRMKHNARSGHKRSMGGSLGGNSGNSTPRPGVSTPTFGSRDSTPRNRTSGKDISGTSGSKTPSGGTSETEDGAGGSRTSAPFRPRRKRTKPNVDEKFKFQPEYRLPEIPDNLKMILVEDHCIMMQRQNKIPKLPADKPISDLLFDYVQDRCKREDQSASTVAESITQSKLKFANDPISYHLKYDDLGAEFRKSCFKELAKGLEAYFNAVLPNQLLYHQAERLQYQDYFGVTPMMDTDSIKDEDSVAASPPRSRKNSADIPSKRPKSSQTYPAIYLLRMMTKMGTYLQYYDADSGQFKLLDIFILDFLKFLSSNPDQYFNIEMDYQENNQYRTDTNMAQLLAAKLHHESSNQSSSDGGHTHSDQEQILNANIKLEDG